MATETATAPNGDVPSFKIVSRLDGIPVVHDSVTYAHHLVNSYSLTASIYQTAVGVASKSYEIATPVLSRGKPVLESVDGLAVATFDRAEATFPYPFKTPTGELVGVKQAKGIYDAHAQPVLHDVLVKTSEINSALGARAHATLHSSQELSHALIEQLKQLSEQGKAIPSVLLQATGSLAGDVKEIVFSKEGTVQEKSNKLGAYVVDQVKPVIDEIYTYVLGAKKKAEEQTGKAVDQVNGQLNGQ
ncbi:hypothetical protein BCR39DRAFT_564285 [Naematelia encephala]|uniref:Uncharacterized protein n=1 Tax=Naematelia encephala TaxID=71784 RepID=A0A1Y2BCJ5_9TREE|nr:hypothetical protein BCR39DRAFT_564285 [Naematelia encephala]